MKSELGKFLLFVAFCAVADGAANAQALPELSVVSVAGPATAGTGQSLVLTNTLANTGGIAATNWHYGIYLSTDAVITTNDTQLFSSPFYGSLNAGTTVPFADTVTIPSGTATGTWYFGVIMDYDNRITESNKANNALASGPVNIGYGPDLTVLSVVGPRNASASQTLTLTNLLANIGVGAAFNWHYRVYLSADAIITTGDVLLATSPLYASLAAGSSNAFSDVVTIPANTSTGVYYFGAIVNYDNSVAESTMTNNARASASVTIGQGPDLTVAAVNGPSSAATGQTVPLTNALANIGVADSGSWHYRIYLSTNAVITTNATVLATSSFFPFLVAGTTNSYVDNVTIPPGTATGTYYFGVIMNYDNSTAESTVINNARASGLVNIGVGPDLAAVSVKGPAAGGLGQTLYLTNTVANLGIGNAGTWRYGIYLSTNTAITTNATLLASSLFFGSLAAGTTNTYVDPVLIPPNISTGIYYFGIIADYDNLVAETTKTNNAISSTQIAIGPGADLAVLSVGGPAIGAAGQILSLTNVLANIGVGSAGSWRYGIYLSSNAVITTNSVQLSSSALYSGFSAGMTNTYVDTVSIPPNTSTGTYYFGVIADIDNLVPETTKTNNAKASSAVTIGPGVDLTVFSVKGPASAGTAQTLVLTNVLANIGIGSAGPWHYGIYLSTDAVITTNDTLLATSPLYSGIAAGASNTYFDSITIPANTATGTYYFGVIADFDNQIAETNKANNAQASSPVNINIGPDLAALSIQGPAFVGISQTLSLTNRLANIGVGATGNWHYRLYLSPDAIITTNDVLLASSPLYASFAAGITNVYVDSITIPYNTTTGTYYYGVIMDYDNIVQESTKTNNTAAAPVTIGYGVDLTVVSVQGPPAASAGQTVILTNLLGNIGVSLAGNWRYRIYLSTNTVITTNATVLATSIIYGYFSPTTTNAFVDSVTIPAGTPSGMYYFGTIIDFDNVVAESNESNNSLASGPVTIGPRISIVSFGTNSVLLQIDGLTTAQQYSVQFSTALKPATGWTTGYVFTAQGPTNWVDAFSPGVTSRFYRVSQP